MTDEIDTGGPAYPSPHSLHRGMTLRDYFAGQVVQAILLRMVESSAGRHKGPEILSAACNEAYEAADAMIAARQAKP